MSKVNNVYYNAVVTKDGALLIAIGWASHGGCTATLDPTANTNHYRLSLEGEGPATQALSPFTAVVSVSPNAKSVWVEDEQGKYQVQLCNISTSPSGGNAPGTWIEFDRR